MDGRKKCRVVAAVRLTVQPAKAGADVQHGGIVADGCGSVNRCLRCGGWLWRVSQLAGYTSLAHTRIMQMIVETPLFKRLWPDYWTEDERGEFAAYLSESPEAGDVVPASGGCRKVRWRRRGSGKSGGVRVIYFNRLACGQVVLLLIYAKSAQENIPAHVLRQIAEEINHADE